MQISEIKIKPLEWIHNEVRSPLGDLYSVMQMSPNVWTTYLNGTAFPGWKAQRSGAIAVAESHYADRAALVTPTDAGKVERMAGPSKTDIEHAISASPLEHAERRPDGTVVNGNIIVGLQTLLGMTLWSTLLPTPEASPAPVEQEEVSEWEWGTPHYSQVFEVDPIPRNFISGGARLIGVPEGTRVIVPMGCSLDMVITHPRSPALDEVRRAVIEECARVADDHTPTKHEGTLAAHVTGATISRSIRALAGGAE